MALWPVAKLLDLVRALHSCVAMEDVGEMPDATAVDCTARAHRNVTVWPHRP